MWSVTKMTKVEYFTSESVTEGHPDKVCDQISDAILDELLKQDPKSRVAVECLTTTGTVHVAGEVTTNGWANVQKIVRATLKEIGYTNPEFGIDCDDAGVWVSIHGQSSDISQGVSEGEGDSKEQGAGDQGMMYGFASNETPELMPLPIVLAHKLTRRLAYVRKEGIVPGLGPDGKSQVSVEYHDGKPKRLNAVVIAQQHVDEIAENELKEQINEHVIQPICKEFLDEDTQIHINATGKFVVGGPEGDTGLTGRKIIVDTYGGLGRHGGGAFSGKDPSKVDRSASYMARYVAKNIVAGDLAERCEVQLAYSIGVAEPVSVTIDTFGTGELPDEDLVRAVRKVFDLTPSGIIHTLQLKAPLYNVLSAYGHFGRSRLPWEETDKVEELKQQMNMEVSVG